MRRAALGIVAVLIVSCGLLLALWLAAPAVGLAHAGGVAPGQAGGQKVAFFESVTLGADDSWSDVVVVGGDVVIEGTVTDHVVVVGGDVTVRKGASVGHNLEAGHDDTAIVCVFGKLTIESGASVSGRAVEVAGGNSAALRNAVVDPVVRPWTLISVILWIASTILIVMVAVIATAIAPKQVAFVGRRARRHAPSSLGWGVLGLFIGVPLLTVVLLVTVVGIIVAVPWFFIGVPLLLLFGYVSIGALIGRLILGGDDARRGRVMLAAVVGVVILSVLRWVPFVGSIVVALALVMGFGATVTSIWQWRRRSRGPAIQPGWAPTATAAALATGGDAPGDGPPPAAEPPSAAPLG